MKRRKRNLESASDAVRPCFAAAVLLSVPLASGCWLPDIAEPGRYHLAEVDLSAGVLEDRLAEIDVNFRAPRTAYRVLHSLGAAENSISSVNGYEALWRGVRACAWLASRHPDRSERKAYAFKGMSMGRAAVEKLSTRVEPHYYTALCLGAFAELSDLPAKDTIRQLKYHAAMAKELDPGFDHCGPLRLLGKLMLETADYGHVGYSAGSLEEALALLEEACTECPEFGENHLFLAEGLERAGEFSRAQEALDRVFASTVPADHSVEHTEWLRDAQLLKERIALEGDESVEAAAFQPVGSDGES